MTRRMLLSGRGSRQINLVCVQFQWCPLKQRSSCCAGGACCQWNVFLTSCVLLNSKCSVCLEQLQCGKRKSGGGIYKEEDYRNRININIVFTHDQGSIWIYILGDEKLADYRFVFFYCMNHKILLICCFSHVLDLK